MESVQYWKNASEANLLELECVPGISHGSWIVSKLRSAETNNINNLFDSLEMNLLRKWNCKMNSFFVLGKNVTKFEFRFSGFCHQRLCKFFVTSNSGGENKCKSRSLPFVYSGQAGCADLTHGARELGRCSWHHYQY